MSLFEGNLHAHSIISGLYVRQQRSKTLPVTGILVMMLR